MSDSTTSSDNEIADNGESTPTTPPREQRRVLISSFLGALIEWYDFYLYGIASAVVLNVLFFPEFDPLVGSLLAFTTLAVGYLARPLGGVIWGHYGDRLGRKKMLVLSIIAMGICTVLMGIMPTYAQIGVAAPIMLIILRLVQGIAAGGEWGGAVLMALEHSPSRKRGLFSSFPQMGLTGGILAANGAFALVSLLPEQQLLSWGWRIPFLFSAVLVGVGLWIRLGVTESPAFRKAQAEARTNAKTQKAPLLAVLAQPRALIITFALALGPFAVSSVYGTWAASYGVEVGFSRTEMLTATLISSAIGFALLPVFAVWSDYVGRKKVVGIGLILQGLSGFVFIGQLNEGSLVGMYWSMAFIAFAHAICYSPLAAWLGELFPIHLRYTGTSVAYQVAGSIGGGLTPAICSGLVLISGGSIWVAIFVAGISLISLIAVGLARETYRAKL